MRGGDSRGAPELRWWHVPAIAAVLFGSVIGILAALEWALHR